MGHSLVETFAEIGGPVLSLRTRKTQVAIVSVRAKIPFVCVPTLYHSKSVPCQQQHWTEAPPFWRDHTIQQRVE